MSDQMAAGYGGPTRRILHTVSRVLGWVSALIIAFMMFATVADVTRRLMTGKPIPGVIEMGEVLMVATVFLGLAYAEFRGAHVRMDLVIRKFSPRTAAAVNSLGLLLVLVILAWMVYVTGERAVTSIETQEYRFGLVQIPVWPGRLAIAIGLAAYFSELLPRFIDNIRKILR